MCLLCCNWPRQSLHSSLLPTPLGPRRVEDIRMGDLGHYRLHHRLHHCLDLGTYLGLPTHLSILGSSKHHQKVTRLRVPLLRRRCRRLRCQHHILRPRRPDCRSSYVPLLESSDTDPTKAGVVRYLCHGLRCRRTGSCASLLQLVHLLWHLRRDMAHMESVSYLHARAVHRMLMRQCARHEGLLQTFLPGKAQSAIQDKNTSWYR